MVHFQVSLSSVLSRMLMNLPPRARNNSNVANCSAYKLRQTHTHLLEEHGTTVALWHYQEAKVVYHEQRETKVQEHPRASKKSLEVGPGPSWRNGGRVLAGANRTSFSCYLMFNLHILIMLHPD